LRNKLYPMTIVVSLHRVRWCDMYFHRWIAP